MGTVKRDDLTKEQLDEEARKSRVAKATQLIATTQGPVTLAATALAFLTVSTAILGASVGILEATLAAFLVLRGFPVLEMRIRK